jgi:hypothetical protein
LGSKQSSIYAFVKTNALLENAQTSDCLLRKQLVRNDECNFRCRAGVIPELLYRNKILFTHDVQVNTLFRTHGQTEPAAHAIIRAHPHYPLPVIKAQRIESASFKAELASSACIRVDHGPKTAG